MLEFYPVSDPDPIAAIRAHIAAQAGNLAAIEAMRNNAVLAHDVTSIMLSEAERIAEAADSTAGPELRTFVTHDGSPSVEPTISSRAAWDAFKTFSTENGLASITVIETTRYLVQAPNRPEQA